MTWTISDEYGASNGNKYICRVYLNGCSMYEGWIVNNRVKSSEDIADVIVAVCWPSRDEVQDAFNGLAMWANKDKKTLRKECVAAWDEMEQKELRMEPKAL